MAQTAGLDPGVDLETTRPSAVVFGEASDAPPDFGGDSESEALSFVPRAVWGESDALPWAVVKVSNRCGQRRRRERRSHCSNPDPAWCDISEP